MVTRLSTGIGGRDRTRTCNFLGANEAICQLIYTPLNGSGSRNRTYDLEVNSFLHYRCAIPE